MARRPKKSVPDSAPFRPTRAQLLAARDKSLPDLMAPRLKVLFVGINPGLYSGAVGHHFARPGNRFWPALHCAGFTPRRLLPHEEKELLKCKCGITSCRIPRRSSFGDGGSSAHGSLAHCGFCTHCRRAFASGTGRYLVNRTTATAAELADAELRAGQRRLRRNVRCYRPRIVAVLGMGAYQTAFGYRGVRIGEQADRVEGARIWVLPSPSGLNANHQAADFARLFRRLRRAAEGDKMPRKRRNR